MNPLLLIAAAAGAYLLLRKRPTSSSSSTTVPPSTDGDTAPAPQRPAKDYAPAKTRGMKATPKKPGGGIVFG